MQVLDFSTTHPTTSDEAEDWRVGVRIKAYLLSTTFRKDLLYTASRFLVDKLQVIESRLIHQLEHSWQQPANQKPEFHMPYSSLAN